MAVIQGVWAREVLDSRGVPTIECTVWLDNGGVVASSIPTSSLVSNHTAVEVRDNDSRLDGLGVLKAVSNINTIIAPQLQGQDPLNQENIDQMMIQLDGTSNKKNLGANAILAVSQAVMKAGALTASKPLYLYIYEKYQLTNELAIPTAIYTMVSGGKHGNDNLDIQEFQIIPASYLEFNQSLDMAVTIFRLLERTLINKKVSHSVGLIGGFTPTLYSNTDVFDLLIETIKSSPYSITQDLFFGINAAADNFYTNGRYNLRDKRGGYSAEELKSYYQKIKDLYRVLVIEDPFNSDDKRSWIELMDQLGDSAQIVSNQLSLTNLEKIKEISKKKLANSVTIKPSQVGTITETIQAIQLAKQAGLTVVIADRTGETNDDFIADFAVGVGANYMKFGPPNRGERVAKYNRLLMIFNELKQAQNSSQTTQTQSTSTSNNS